jgi:hypothetical protein
MATNSQAASERHRGAKPVIEKKPHGVKVQVSYFKIEWRQSKTFKGLPGCGRSLTL